MKKYLLLFILYLPIAGFSQCDDFSDGDFTNNWTWTGYSGMFIVNGSQQLQLNHFDLVASPAMAYLSTSDTTLDTCWTFWSKINVNTSTVNNARFYLMSDSANLHGSLHGYYVQLGGANDNIALYRQDDTISTKIINGTSLFTGHFFDNIFTIKVVRTYQGDWKLYSDSLAGTNYTLEGAVTDNTYLTSSYFGLLCNYVVGITGDRYYFDNICIYPDTTANSIKDVSEIRAESINLRPNPTSSTLEVSSLKLKADKVEVFNLQGQQLMQLKGNNQNSLVLDVSAIVHGVYVVKVFSENGVAVKKFVKE